MQITEEAAKRQIFSGIKSLLNNNRGEIHKYCLTLTTVSGVKVTIHALEPKIEYKRQNIDEIEKIKSVYNSICNYKIDTLYKIYTQSNLIALVHELDEFVGWLEERGFSLSLTTKNPIKILALSTIIFLGL